MYDDDLNDHFQQQEYSKEKERQRQWEQQEVYGEMRQQQVSYHNNDADLVGCVIFIIKAIGVILLIGVVIKMLVIGNINM